MRALVLRIEVSGIEFCRDMMQIFGGSDGVRTITFPIMVTTIRQGSFYQIKSLQSVVLNDALRTLGTDGEEFGQAATCGIF